MDREAVLTKDASDDDFYPHGPLIYSEGMDCAIDLVSAHCSFNLAASRGHRRRQAVLPGNG